MPGTVAQSGDRIEDRHAAPRLIHDYLDPGQPTAILSAPCSR